MPVFGVEKYIENSITSVIKQTYQNFELVIVNDDTKDKSIEIAEKVLVGSNINYRILNKKNGGLGDSRNYGLHHADGEWALFLDSDDILLPSTLEDMVEVLNANHKVDFIFTYFQNVSIGEEFKESSINDGIEFMDRTQIQNDFLSRKKVILAPGTLINRKWLLDSNIFFKKVPYSEDQLFVWEMLINCENVVLIKKQLYNYLHRPNSIMTSTKFNKIIDAYDFFYQLNLKIQNDNRVTASVKSFLLSRWVLGILNSSAKLSSFEEYKIVCKSFDGRNHMKNLIHFPSLKVKLASIIYLISKKIYYKINNIK